MDGDHGPPEAVANLRAMVDAITRPLVAKHVGVVVGASIGPTRVVSGFAGRGQAKPRGDAVFQIGSITKVFTALALADAVTSSELSLDTPLASLLPTSSHPNASAITLGQLASHTSGLPRLPAGLRRQARRPRRTPTATSAEPTWRLPWRPHARGPHRESACGTPILGRHSSVKP